MTLAPDSPHASASLDAELDGPRRAFVDRIWIGAGCLAALQVPLIAGRAATVGWHVQLMIHAALSAMALAVALLRRRLPQGFKAALLVAGFLSVGLAGLLSMGMTGAGYFWTVLGIGTASVLFSLRAGIVLAVASAVAASVAGALFVGGRLAKPFDLNVHAVSVSGWVNYLVVTIFVSLVMLIAIGGFQRALLGLIGRLQAQRDQLIAQRDQLDAQRDRLQILATHDPLTGLPLTSLVHDRLKVAINVARRTGERVALLFIDLDGFKAVNDNHGHEAGDAVLRTVAKRLRAAVRAEDTVARVGGDEFIVVLARQARPEAALEVARKIIAALAQPMAQAGVVPAAGVGSSVGIASFPDHADDARELRRLADAAMYRAKREGSNRYCVAGSESVVEVDIGATANRDPS